MTESTLIKLPNLCISDYFSGGNACERDTGLYNCPNWEDEGTGDSVRCFVQRLWGRGPLVSKKELSCCSLLNEMRNQSPENILIGNYPAYFLQLISSPFHFLNSILLHKKRPINDPVHEKWYKLAFRNSVSSDHLIEVLRLNWILISWQNNPERNIEKVSVLIRLWDAQADMDIYGSQTPACTFSNRRAHMTILDSLPILVYIIPKCSLKSYIAADKSRTLR